MLLFRRSFIAAMLLIMSISGNAHGEKGTGFHYRMNVRIDPANHKLEADISIENPPAARFYLRPGFAVRQVKVNGKDAPFHQDASPDSSMYKYWGTPYAVDAENVRELRVTYAGEIPKAVNMVNMINPEMVELAAYSAWYPVFAGMADNTFELEIDLPDSFLVTTNGKLKKQREKGDRSLSRWTSFAPGWDIAILASPVLHKIEGGNRDSRIEVYSRDLPEQVLKTQIDSLAAGIHYLSSIYGSPRVKGLSRIVYSPWNGWGYSRIPLVVVPEKRALGIMKKEYGDTLVYRDVCHEICHFWWLLADTDTPDDWINEGMTEFSAFRLSEKQFGKAFAEVLIREYQEHARMSKTSTPIAETERFSPDSYINRYEKTTLMFIEARNRFGEDALNRLFFRINSRFDRAHKITTALFLEEAGKQMGGDAREFFRETLYRKWEVEQPAK